MLLTRFSSSPQTCYEVSSLHGCLQLQACIPNQRQMAKKIKVQVPPQHQPPLTWGRWVCIGVEGRGCLVPVWQKYDFTPHKASTDTTPAGGEDTSLLPSTWSPLGGHFLTAFHVISTDAVEGRRPPPRWTVMKLPREEEKVPHYHWVWVECRLQHEEGCSFRPRCDESHCSTCSLLSYPQR